MPPKNPARDPERRTTVLIAAGGTAGHVVPSLAVAAELTARGDGGVRRHGRPDRGAAGPAAGYPLHTYPVTGLPRRPTPALSAGSAWPALAPAACVRILREVRPDVVFGGGGYVAGPMLAAAGSCAIPAALLEVDAHLGLANRLALRSPVECSWRSRSPGKDPPRIRSPAGRSRVRCSMRAPRRDGASSTCPTDRQGGAGVRREPRRDHHQPAAAAAWAASDPGFTVVNITGEREFALYSGRAAPHYRVMAWTSALGPLLAAADLVVSRAGGSVFEIAAAGKPAMLVPSPNVTGDHQSRTPRTWPTAVRVVVEDAELTAARLESEVTRCSPSRAGSEAMSEAARRLARPDAAERIAASSWSWRGDRIPRSSPAHDRHRRRRYVGAGRVAYAWGAQVSGCDRAPSEYTAAARAVRHPCGGGPRPRPSGAGMEVVVSSAVPDDAGGARGARAAACGASTGRSSWPRWSPRAARSASPEPTARRPPPP